MTKRARDVVDRVRDARRKISERVGHDPDELVHHYQELDQKCRDRLLQDAKRDPDQISA